MLKLWGKNSTEAILSSTAVRTQKYVLYIIISIFHLRSSSIIVTEVCDGDERTAPEALASLNVRISLASSAISSSGKVIVMTLCCVL